MRRIAAISAVAMLLFIVAALVLVQLPFARARVFRFAAQQLAALYDLDLRATELHYNVLTRVVSLDDVRLSAVGHDQEPFLTARRVSIALAWTIFRGLLAFDRIELDEARVTMLRRADGSSNLPQFDEPTDAARAPLTLDVRGLVLRGLDFAYADEGREFRIDAGGLHANLERRLVDLRSEAVGPIKIQRGVQVQMGERRLEAQPISGRMAFDGSSVALEGVGLSTREGTITVDGDVLRVLDEPALDLRFDGTADLARAADWGTLPLQIGGSAAVRGTIAGPAAGPTITVDAKSDAVQLGGLERAAIDASVNITPSVLIVERASLREGAGVLEATAQVEFADTGATEVKAEWRDLDASTVLRLLEGQDPGTPKGVPSDSSAAGTAKAAPSVSSPRVAASLTGRMTLQRRGEQPLTLAVENRSSTPSTIPRDTVPLSGTLSLDTRDGQWTAKQAHALGELTVDGTLGGRITNNDFASATIEGALVVESPDVASASNAIEHLNVDLPAIATNLHGPLHATVNLSGRVDALQALAAVSSDALIVPGVAPAAVQADVSVTPDRVDVPAFTATIGQATLTGNATVDLQKGTLGGGFSLNAPDAGELLTSLPDNARIEGPITATATLGGSTSAPEVRTELEGNTLVLADQAVEHLTAIARITADTAFVDSFNLTAGAGSLSGSGSYGWEKQAYTANLEGKDLAWRGQVAGDAETEVRITQLTFAGSGTVDAPGGQGKVAFHLAGGPAGDIVEQGDVDVSLDGTNAIIDARLPSLGAQVKATVLTSAPYTFDAVADIKQLDLLPLANIAGFPPGGVLGRLTLSATAHGEAANAAESTEVSASLQQIAATVGDVPVWLPTPAQVSWRKDDIRVDSLTLGLGSGLLTASGRLAPGTDTHWTSTFKGELGDLVRAARGVSPDVPAELSASGSIATSWQSTGGIEQSSGTVTLTGGQVNWVDVPPITALALQGGFDGTTITLSSLTGVWQEGGITATATLPRAILDGSAPSASGSAERGHAQVKVTGLTQSALQPWLDSAALARIAGRVSASFDADILGTRVNDIAGTLVLDEAVLTLADIEVQQTRPTKIGIKDARVTMEDVSWTAGGGPLALTGNVILDAPEGATLDLGVKGDLNLGLFSAFAPTTWTAGSAVIDVTASGLASDPDVQGRIELQNGEVAVFNPRLILYDLNGVIALDRRHVRFGGIGGSLNGGSLRLDGQLGFSEDGENTGQLIVELGQVALEYPEGLQSEVDGLLTFAPRGQDWQLGGDVRIARSSYRENISLPALAAARRTRPPVAVDAEPTFLDRLRLNLFVVTEEDLVVDNNYGRIAAGAGIRVVGTGSEPALNGRVTLREGGEVFLAGRTFRVERGAISFTNPSRIEPELDIELRTLASGIDVALTLNGTMDQLKTEVRSTSPDRTDKEAQEALYGNLGAADAATLLSAELLGATGRAVGLDALRIERGVDSEEVRNDPTLIIEEFDADTSTRLTLAKRIRPDVELIISRALQESGGVSAAVSYMVRRNIELRASQREDTDRALAVRHEITFGGGRAPRSSTEAPQPRVAAIQITGEPGRAEAEIRALLHLEEGDRFAFHEWQADVDRIKESYTKLGYFEARVRPTREASTDNQIVTLTYRIDQGPKTNIVIDGHPLHQDLLEELQDAWSRAIFDRFLIDDVRWRVQRDLIDEGYVGNKVDPRVVQPNPQTKELRIAVTPGVKVSGREIRFAGNEGFNRGRLEGVLAQQGLQDTVWLDQSQLTRAIETFYREQGYLAVKVSAEAPKVEGDRGVLPVKIEEGRRFAFAKPTLDGVAETRRMLLEETFSGVLYEGVPYDATAVDQARQLVERFYYSQGFNNARIESRSTSDQAAGTVTVAFSIQEGLQQVLREVTTEGDDRTRDGVVRRALRLMVGAPVDLAQWGQARKRMYDTNVFAQVDIEPVPIAQTEEDKAAGIEPVHAVVRVVEYPEWRLRYGLQVNDQRTGDEDIDVTTRTRTQNLGVLADIQNRNIFGRAIAGGLAARVERDRQIGTLFASNGSFFGLPIRTQTFLFTSRLHDREPLDILIDRVGTSIEQRWQAFRRTEVVYAYRYDQTRTYENIPSPEIDNTNHTGKVTAGLIFDLRDDPFTATRGWFTAANYEHAARILGGDSRNSKLFVQQYYFHPLGKVVLASRAQIGAAFGKDPLIQQNRFFLGGATTVRGYGEDTLGPRDAFGLPGGQALLLLNQELRFPIKWWFNGVAFIDAGNVYATRGELSFSDLSVGYGFGLRLNTPFAMLRVDFGVPGSTTPNSTRRANSFGSGRWYIGIGHVF